MARLFFALWPSAGARSGLASLATEVAAQSGGRAVPEAKIHLTLAFLGEVAPQRMASALSVAGSLAGQAFDLELDRIGSFPRAGVAWAGASRTPPALEALAAALANGLRCAGVELEERPFAAHVTLARRIIRRPVERAVAPIAWQAREFALVESDLRTGHYATRERWELEAR